MKGLRPGDVVSADILVMLNIPSRENYRYVLHIIDHATKQSWVYPLKTRESKELLVVLKQFVEEDYLPKLNNELMHFYSDGGSEFIEEEVLQFLHRSHVNTSHTPRDTPEMNSLSERRTRTIKEQTLCIMLLRASLPVAFWWDALRTAVYIINRMPTKTAL